MTATTVRARDPWTSCVGLTALLLVVGPASAQQFTFERSFASESVTRLEISTHRGTIRVKASDDDQVVVSGTANVRSVFNMPVNQRELAGTVSNHPPVDLRGTLLTVTPPADPLVDRAITLDYVVQIPTGTPVVATSDSGAVTIDARTGAVSVRTQTGAIVVTVPTGQGVTLDVTTGGKIDLDPNLLDAPPDKGRARGDVAGGGPRWQLTSQHGDIHVHGPQPDPRGTRQRLLAPEDRARRRLALRVDVGDR